MVRIAVRGSAARAVEAERALVRLAIEAQSDDRAAAVRTCAAAQRALVETLEELVEHGAVEHWTASRLTTRVDWRQRQFDAGAEPEQVARVDLRVEFHELAGLGDWLAAVAEDTAVRVEGVDWDVRRGTRIEIERELRTEAVGEALRRAQDYADALRLGDLVVVALHEPGLRDRDDPHAGVVFRGMTASAGGGFQLRAEPVELTAAVSLDVTAE